MVFHCWGTHTDATVTYWTDLGRGIEAESERPKGQLEVEREYRKFRRSANSITGHSSFLTPPKAVSVILGRGRYIIILKGEKKKGRKKNRKTKHTLEQRV